MTDYIINEKGDEVISERHQKDFKKEDDYSEESESESDEVPVEKSSGSFTDVNFEDI
jgi:hypothetical protein